MRNSEEKGASSGVPTTSIGQQPSNVANGNPRIRIAVYGQHEVGKSGNFMQKFSLTMTLFVWNFMMQIVQIVAIFFAMHKL